MGLTALALAITLDDAALFKFTRTLAAGAAIVVLCALIGPGARLMLASFASATFGVGLAVRLVRAAGVRPKVFTALAALFAVTPLIPRLLFADASRRHRMLGDHEFLVGRDHEDDRRRILGADDLRIGAVRFGVETDAHPFHVLERRFAHFP
jgi:hypothetical protein